jgi:hypothetical protein
MQKVFNSAMTVIRREFPNMGFVKAWEPQSDGYPHLHAILIGPDANHPKLLSRLRALFVKHGGMGSFLNLEAKPEIKNPKHAVRYMMKYVSKLPRVPGGMSTFLPKGRRLFSQSNSVRAWFEKKVASMFFAVAFGEYVQDAPEGARFRDAKWEIGEVWEAPPPPGFAECMEFFDEIINSRASLKQLTLGGV